jgi:hypothetical protein
LTGVVHEAAPSRSLVSNSRVEITGGADSGAFVMTDGSGFFRFSSLAGGVVSMQVKKDGYLLWRIANLTIDQDRALDVALFPIPPSNGAGVPATARCTDGSWSWARTLGEACSANGGVAYGVCPGPLCDGR